MSYPILYSLQHCPYAMRARMGVLLSEQPVYLRAIILKNKPREMLEASPKGTVPVLVFDNQDSSKLKVIDESLDVMLWALRKNDPSNLLYSNQPDMLKEMLYLIILFDTEFKPCLERYKSAKRYHGSNREDCRLACEKYIALLEKMLYENKYVVGEQLSLVDYAILPYIRQFARVERQWYLASPYPKTKHWLKSHLESPVFSKIMKKYPLWLEGHDVVIFGGANSN
ncbi:MAG: glutathione S-transferase [Kangiellaceae bacterium]|nr:glutathione S-transferase [Kangiellaceae bacterium]